MTYAQLTRFILPLVLTALVQELSGQFLNGGMARMPRATETLAAFGLAADRGEQKLVQADMFLI